MSIEDLIKSLPKEILENPASLDEQMDIAEAKVQAAKKRDKERDKEFRADEEAVDVEDSIAEQEKHERKAQHKIELQELEAESEFSLQDKNCNNICDASFFPLPNVYCYHNPCFCPLSLSILVTSQTLIIILSTYSRFCQLVVAPETY